MSMKDANTLLAWAFATSSIPFFVVENAILRRFIEIVSGGNYELPHRTSIRTKVIHEGKRVEGLVKTIMNVSKTSYPQSRHANLI